ncbi:MAG: hypothetical protein QRY16_01730 [Enterobacterales bacterium endosymbiont of Blomia tropicalis]|uniref:hypothetical protein n=1 Tax=Mixta mediterraneensis TaxID=2758443 RepID=UPI0025A6BB82|nr:hypothetical protein [Mixta mediterraneensis]MDL4912540.1 hypothetical protein [Mixta mediterraneensis]
MTTSELNKERLQTIASWRAKYSAGHNVVLPAEEAEMMARSLLAAMEQEPFGYYSAEVPIILEQQSHANITREAMGEYQFPLYRIPLPVVSYYRDGIEAAAKWVDQQREAYDNQHGRHDPDTGSFEFGNDAQRDYSSTLVDIADGIRKLHPNAGKSLVIGLDPASGPDKTVEVRYFAPPGYVIVPIVPTEDMIINGFESEPDPHFSDEKEWEEYEALSGCRQAARRAELCWAAMIKAVPKQETL